VWEVSALWSPANRMIHLDLGVDGRSQRNRLGGGGYGPDSSGSGYGQWRAAVNTVMNLRVP
jgi:hypothetical protein